MEEIELSLLLELQKILEGKQADEAATARAKAITDAIGRADKERADAERPAVPAVVKG